MKISPKDAQLAATPKGTEDLTGWVLEPKYDGWRMLVVVEQDGIRWFGRSAIEYSGRTPEIDKVLQLLPVGTVLDGELTHKDGWRHAQSEITGDEPPSGKLEFYVFDLLQVVHPATQEKVDVRQTCTLLERRDMLECLASSYNFGGQVKLATQTEYSQEAVKALVAQGWEGGVAKNPKSFYKGGKRTTWLKFKAEWTEDAVVYGGVGAKGELEGLIGSLKIGQYNEKGELVPLGNSWGKFTNEERVFLTQLWKCGELDKETMIVELTIQGFTNKGKFRAPVIQRIRKDKEPSECTYTDKSEIYAL